MEERRKSGRVRLNLPACLETESGPRSGVVLNGSTDGCFVHARVEEPGDDPVQVGVRLPHGEWIYLWGEVVYYLPTEGLGLQFTSPTAEAALMLNEWLRYLSSVGETAMKREFTKRPAGATTAAAPR